MKELSVYECIKTQRAMELSSVLWSLLRSKVILGKRSIEVRKDLTNDLIGVLHILGYEMIVVSLDHTDYIYIPGGVTE